VPELPSDPARTFPELSYDQRMPPTFLIVLWLMFGLPSFVAGILVALMPREVYFREGINAVGYLVGSGGGWRMVPIHFGLHRTVS
jgi:hypothetical protein